MGASLSALNRATLNEATVVGYWPLENIDRSAQSAPSGLADGPDATLRPQTGPSYKLLEWSAESTLVGSGSLPALTTEYGLGGVNATFTTAGDPAIGIAYWTKTDLLATSDSTSTFTQAIILLAQSSGSPAEISAVLTQYPPTSVFATDATYGSAELQAGAGAPGATVTNKVEANTTFSNDWRFVFIRFAQSGSDVSVSMQLDGAVLSTGTLTSVTLGNIRQMRAALFSGDSVHVETPRVAFGHLTILAGSTTDLDTAAANLYEAGLGHDGETATTRFARLCTENSIAYNVAT